MNGRRLVAGSLFSGVGGLDLGLARAGFEHAFFAELDPWRREVLAAHWSGVHAYPDVRDVGNTGDAGRSVGYGGAAGNGRQARGDVHSRPREQACDLLCGGFPCQDLSVAGRRRGLAGARSGLFHEFVRIADALRPSWILLENVPGLLSSNDGRDMAVVLGSLADLGYGWAYRVLDARYFGVPQRRRRVFIVGRAGGDAESALRVVCEGCGGDSAPRICSWTRTTSGPGGCVAGTLRSAGHDASEDGSGRQTLVVGALGAAHGGPDDNDAQAGRIVVGTLAGTSPGGGWRIGADEAAAGHLVTAKCLTASDRYDADTEDFIAFHPTQNPTTSHAFHRKQDPISGQISPALGVTSGGMGVGNAAGVRRLTPIECERLMSWPDNWTAPESVKSPDSRRYAACGDGVVANVAEWIGRGILAEA
jgi:DNA (cytosine-5)-methyltransferase 1